jgi:hypothetical protein
MTLARGTWVVLPATIGILSRAFSVLLVAVTNAATSAPRPDPLTMWDGVWYVGIARDGYHAAVIRGGQDFAFFPGWPLAMRASSLGFLPVGVASVIAANVLFVVALVVMWRLLARRFSNDCATVSVALLAFSPPAFVFSLAYSESLFLLIAVLFYSAGRRSIWRVPLAALAMLTRLAGIAVVASSVIQALRTRGAERRLAVGAVIGGLAGFAAWWVFIAILTNDPVGYLKGSSAWIQREPIWVVLATIKSNPIRVACWTAFVVSMVVGTAYLYRRDRELFVYSAVVLAVGMIPLVTGGLLHSVPRYDLVAFPAFAGLADRLGGRRSRLLLVAFAIGQALLVWWVVPMTGSQSP